VDIEAYFESVSLELQSQRDRVRQLIGTAHWPTDGQWKESVLRSVLRRMIGEGVRVGSGFAVQGTTNSKQIDLLIYRADSPVLFRDGDLVVVPAAGVRAVIEVKTRLTSRNLTPALEHLAEICTTLERDRRRCVVGLFSYETQVSNQAVLAGLRTTCERWPLHIDLVCHGPDRFVRYYKDAPGGGIAADKWHSYAMPRLAYGYFIQNIISHVAPADLPTSGPPFYPPGGKEDHRDGAIYHQHSLNEALEHFRTATIDAPAV
jgi:hypothetical protein